MSEIIPIHVELMIDSENYEIFNSIYENSREMSKDYPKLIQYFDKNLKYDIENYTAKFVVSKYIAFKNCRQQIIYRSQLTVK